MTESEEKVYVKVPTFDGRKSKWPFFKSKMISYLAQKNMSELLSFNGNIEKDNKTWSNQEMQRDEVKQVIQVLSSFSMFPLKLNNSLMFFCAK